MNNAIVTLKDVKKSYPSGNTTIHVLRGIDLQVIRGDFIGITGPSGSGKSTLLSIMGTLENPDSGEILYGDISINGLSDEAISDLRNKKIGFVFQFYNLLPEFTALENVMLPLILRGINSDEARKKALGLLDQLGLKDRHHHFPSELSGGERQRIAVARALITNPDIILADEPTGNLNRHNADLLMEILKSLNERGVTIVLVTHNDELKKFFKKSYKLLDGKLIPDGKFSSS